MEQIKQVIILRKDLNMRKGKMVAQGAHASMKVFFDKLVSDKSDNSLVINPITQAEKEWIYGRFTKITVSVNSEQELLEIYEKAKNKNLPVSLILDAGLTEFKEPTYTAVAIGPADSEVINTITGHLPLL